MPSLFSGVGSLSLWKRWGQLGWHRLYLQPGVHQKRQCVCAVPYLRRKRFRKRILQLNRPSNMRLQQRVLWRRECVCILQDLQHKCYAVEPLPIQQFMGHCSVHVQQKLLRGWSNVHTVQDML